MKKCLYIEPIGGLCNRLRSIIGAYELSKRLNKKLVVIWVKNSEINYPLSKLFSTPKDFNLREYNAFQGKIIRRLYPKQADLLLKDPNIPKNTDDLIELCSKHSKIYIISCNHCIKSSDYSMFKPTKMISQLVKDITKQYTNNTIGIHIRRTDNTVAIAHSKTEDFIVKINEEIEKDKDVKFFLATDSKDEKSRLLSIYHDRIITRDNLEFDRNSQKGIIDSTVDFLCLANTRKILASYWSSFSDIATEFYGITKDVIK